MSFSKTTKGYEAVGPIYWLAFNLRKKPFDDIRVRQAFAYSIDRDFIVKTIFEGLAVKATGPISPDSPLYSPDVEHYKMDIQKANDLLDAAGYPRDKTGKRFETTLHFLPGVKEFFYVFAEYLRDDLFRKIGVELKISKWLTFAQWSDSISNGDFTITLDTVFNWGDPVIGAHRAYDCNNIRKGVIWSNTQGYCNPKVNELTDAAGSEMNFDKRKALYAEFQKIVVSDLPVYYIMQIPYVTMYPKHLKRINDSVWGTLSPLDRVYWEKTP
ncbi:MAG: hypothetical protein GY749_09145 [Desulfobacteraceae bacterium]|nr:hypothetical protein [Desulfobacteraceae bacterium]